MFSYRKICLMLFFVLLLTACGCGREPDTTTTESGLPGSDISPTAPAGTTKAVTPSSTGKTQPSDSKTTASPVIPPATDIPKADYPFEPTTSGIYVTREGDIRSAEITSFDNSTFPDKRYDEAELKTFIEENVKTYNEAKGTEAVTIDSLTVKDGTAELLLSYFSFTYFLDFQGDDFGIRYLALLTKENAIRNYDIGSLKDPAGNPADLMIALEQEDIKVLIVAGTGNVTVNGDIYFLSESLVLNDVNSVTCTDDAGYSFIIFR